MGMAVGTGRPKADLNVVPLIDIVLVLLIIFMVLTPMVQRGYDMSIPEKAEIDQPVQASEQMVLNLTEDGRILINKEEVELGALRTKLEDLLRGRHDKTIFFQAHDNVFYQEAIEVMDAMRAAGAVVGLVTTDLQQ